MNRRQFLPLFAAPAVVVLLKLKQKEEQPVAGYMMTWTELHNPESSRGFNQALLITSDLVTQLKRDGAAVHEIGGYTVKAEMSFRSFLSATAYKSALVRSKPPNRRLISTARIERSNSYQPPTSGYRVSWERESSSSWDAAWPFQPGTNVIFSTHDEVYEDTLKHNIQIVSQDEQATTIPLWSLEQYFNTEAEALHRYQEIERSFKYNRDTLKLERI